MRIDPSTSNVSGPSNPFHIARAYGVRAPEATREISPTRPVESRTPEESRNTLPSAAQRLVAGVVAGGIEFGGETARPSAPAPSLQMYRHPADKNAAATAVRVGRSLDVTG